MYRIKTAVKHCFAIICARRWQNSKGVTYYITTTRLIVGDCISERFRKPIAYGYGDAYINETADWLKERGYWPLDEKVGGSVTLVTSVTDVSTRAQLLRHSL